MVTEYHRRASGKAVIDYGFHLIVSDPTERALVEDLPALIQEGCTSFKIFMTYEALKLTDRQILSVMDVARKERALVLVHAENHDAIAWASQRLLAEGKTAPKYHAESRPAAVEREAVHRIITLAELAGVNLLIVHVSSADALEQIRWARGRGLPIYAETCPQYLFFSADDLDRPGLRGREIRVQPAAARPRQSECALERLGRTVRPRRVLFRSRAVSLQRRRLARPSTEPTRRSRRFPTGCPVWKPPCRFCFPRACAPAASRSSSSSR